MIRHHKYFIRGRVVDGDSSDIEGDALRECINMDPDTALGELSIRRGLVPYTDEYPDFKIPVPKVGDRPLRLVRVFRWMSGGGISQRNTILVFRYYDFEDNTPTGTPLNYWCLFSNAPYGGDNASPVRWFLLCNAQQQMHHPAGYTDDEVDLSLTDLWDATHCNLVAEEGAVRVAWGRTSTGVPIDYFIHEFLCDPEIYENGIRSTPLYDIDNTTCDFRPYGEGGIIVNGWLWDYGKPYNGNIFDKSSVGQYYLTITPIKANPGMAVADYDIYVVPVFDHCNYGVPMRVQIPQDVFQSFPDGMGLEIEINPCGGFNFRLTHLCFYVVRTNRPGYADDYTPIRFLSLPYDSRIRSTRKYTIDGDTILKAFSTWKADGKGRPIFVDDVDFYSKQTYSASTKSNSKYYDWRPTADAVDKLVSVKPEGIVIRRARAYAWGIAGDSGKTRIAVSQPDDIRGGQLDIFPPDLRIWHEQSQEITHAMELGDRLAVFNRNNFFLFDLEQRVQDTYQELAGGYGVGTACVDTITRTPYGLFFANEYSVYQFTGQMKDLAVKVFRNEWNAISAAWKRDAKAGYNPDENEYWLMLKTASNVEDHCIYTVYVYSIEKGIWKIYRFCQSFDQTLDRSAVDLPTFFLPSGIYDDYDKNVVVYGYYVGGPASGNMIMIFRENEIDFSMPINYLIRSQWQGQRTNEEVIIRANVERSRGMADYTLSDPTYATVYLRLYAWHNESKPVVMVGFPPNRRHPAPVPALRTNEYMFELFGAWDKTSYSDPIRIYEITVVGLDVGQRKKE